MAIGFRHGGEMELHSADKSLFSNLSCWPVGCVNCRLTSSLLAFYLFRLLLSVGAVLDLDLQLPQGTYQRNQ